MRFTRTTDQQDMAAALRDLLESLDAPGIAREWAREGTDAWKQVWGRLAGMGVAGVAIPERHGGLGLGAVELVACLEELGYSGLPGPYLESIAVLPALLAETDAERPWLSQLASGEATATAAFPGLVPHALDADVADAVFVCDGNHAYVPREPSPVRQQSFDPTRRLFSLAASGEPIERARVRTAFDFGVLGCAAQLLGIGRRLLDISTRHVKAREQFGRPIGQFQSVKHHLANVLLKLEFGRPLLHGACLSLAAGEAHSARDVSAAKVALGDAAYSAARTALQVHGAIGYTVEHDLHLWLTKATALRSAWGTTAWHRQRVADALATGLDAPVGRTN